MAVFTSDRARAPGRSPSPGPGGGLLAWADDPGSNDLFAANGGRVRRSPCGRHGLSSITTALIHLGVVVQLQARSGWLGQLAHGGWLRLLGKPEDAEDRMPWERRKVRSPAMPHSPCGRQGLPSSTVALITSGCG